MNILSFIFFIIFVLFSNFNVTSFQKNGFKNFVLSSASAQEESKKTNVQKDDTQKDDTKKSKKQKQAEPSNELSAIQEKLKEEDKHNLELVDKVKGEEFSVKVPIYEVSTKSGSKLYIVASLNYSMHNTIFDVGSFQNTLSEIDHLILLSSPINTDDPEQRKIINNKLSFGNDAHFVSYFDDKEKYLELKAKLQLNNVQPVFLTLSPIFLNSILDGKIMQKFELSQSIESDLINLLTLNNVEKSYLVSGKEMLDLMGDISKDTQIEFFLHNLKFTSMDERIDVFKLYQKRKFKKIAKIYDGFPEYKEIFEKNDSVLLNRLLDRIDEISKVEGKKYITIIHASKLEGDHGLLKNIKKKGYKVKKVN